MTPRCEQAQERWAKARPGRSTDESRNRASNCTSDRPALGSSQQLTCQVLAACQQCTRIWPATRLTQFNLSCRICCLSKQNLAIASSRPAPGAAGLHSCALRLSPASHPCLSSHRHKQLVSATLLTVPGFRPSTGERKPPGAWLCSAAYRCIQLQFQQSSASEEALGAGGRHVVVLPAGGSCTSGA